MTIIVYMYVVKRTLEVYKLILSKLVKKHNETQSEKEYKLEQYSQKRDRIVSICTVATSKWHNDLLK